MQRQIPTHLGHVADAMNACHIGNLVWIGHNRSDAARHHRRCELGWRAEATFNVNMCIDQAGRNEGPVKIDGF